jgi:hypothetical protein
VREPVHVDLVVAGLAGVGKRLRVRHHAAVPR